MEARSAVIIGEPVATPAIIRGRYRPEAMIGRGGAKDVYRALDQATGQHVALAKIFSPDPRAFDREIRLARRVSGEHVARILDAFLEADSGYLVMELCEGPTLADLVERGPVGLDRAAPMMLALARGVAAIHSAHVLHRDLKLENVVLSRQGVKVKLSILDFGLALEVGDDKTCAGIQEPAGTFGYCAPEVMRGEAVDARTDVYAAGICFYRLLTADFPLPPSKPYVEYIRTVADLEAHELSALASFPEAIRNLIGRMLSVDRTVRPYMPEVCRALEPIAGVAAVPAVSAPEPSSDVSRAVPAPMSLNLALFSRFRSDVALRPEWISIATCSFAPLIAIKPGADQTTVRALTADGALRWRTQILGRFDAVLRCDLDGDGVREIYLIGERVIASLDLRGFTRFIRPRSGASASTAVALTDHAAPRLFAGGEAYDGSGAEKAPLPFVYRGDGRELVNASDPRGLSYNGFAHQAFTGSHGTPAAILMRPGDRGFHVAHLELGKRGPNARAVLSLYGPGGRRSLALDVATAEPRTGAVRRLVPSFDDRQGPIAALLPNDEAIVIAPLIGEVDPFAPCVVAFRVPEGRELWRLRVEPSAQSRALLADADGDGRPEVIVSTGTQVLVIDLESGRILKTLDLSGAPFAYGDPFSSGFGHLFLTTTNGIDVWRGGEVLPGFLQWSGPRADLWRSGTLRENGAPLGPV